MSRSIYRICGSLLFLVGATLLSCESKDNIYAETNYGTLNYTVAANANLSYYNQILSQSGLKNTLGQPGPYTVFVPNDASFTYAGYTLASLASTESRDWASQLANYLIAEGRYTLGDFSFEFNTAIKSRNGHVIYVSRWVPEVGGQTVYTVNGVPTLRTDITADNGLIHVLDKIPVINTYSNLADRIAGTNNLALFFRALQVSGLDKLLKDPGSYTVFAPTNEAMHAYGFANLQAVDDADPKALASLVRRHVLPQVYFRYDFKQLMAYNEKGNFTLDYDNKESGTADSVETEAVSGSFDANMLSNTPVTFSYAYATIDGVYMDRLSITSGGIGAATLVNQKDYVADNGVLHAINAVLPGTENDKSNNK